MTTPTPCHAPFARALGMPACQDTRVRACACAVWPAPPNPGARARADLVRTSLGVCLSACPARVLRARAVLPDQARTLTRQTSAPPTRRGGSRAERGSRRRRSCGQRQGDRASRSRCSLWLRAVRICTCGLSGASAQLASLNGHNRATARQPQATLPVPCPTRTL